MYALDIGKQFKLLQFQSNYKVNNFNSYNVRVYVKKFDEFSKSI
jgi:hypothetical protein